MSRCTTTCWRRRDDARLILDRDPVLAGERGKDLGVLMYLIEHDATVKYLRSG